MKSSHCVISVGEKIADNRHQCSSTGESSANHHLRNHVAAPRYFPIFIHVHHISKSNKLFHRRHIKYTLQFIAFSYIFIVIFSLGPVVPAHCALRFVWQSARCCRFMHANPYPCWFDIATICCSVFFAFCARSSLIFILHWCTILRRKHCY